MGLVGRLSTRPNSGAEEKLDEADDEVDDGLDGPRDDDDDEGAYLEDDSGGSELDAADPKNIEYDKWSKISYRTASGEQKTKWDFVTVVVTLTVFWTDVIAYFYRFAAHNDQAKWNDNEWTNLKKNFRRGEYCVVMDASEAPTSASARTSVILLCTKRRTKVRCSTSLLTLLTIYVGAGDGPYLTNAASVG